MVAQHRVRAIRVLKALLAVVVVPIVVGVVVVLALANTPWGNEKVRQLVVSQANKRLTGSLSIGKLRGGLLSNGALSDVVMLDSAKRPVFSARRAEIHYDIWDAIQGRVTIRSVVLDTPFIVLDKRPGQHWNFQDLLRPSTSKKDTTQKSPPPQLSNITIHHGRFLYRRPWTPDSTLSGSKRDSAIAAALAPTARKRTERVAGGFQRVLDYHDLDVRLPAVVIGSGGAPTRVEIAALSMIAEPYRPPVIDVRSLVGTLFASKDSLWWRGAHMVMPNSDVRGDGTIGAHKSGFRLDLTGAPIALADLRWLDPKLTESGGGKVRYVMNLHGDTADFAISDADLRYGVASLVGHAAIASVKATGSKAKVLVRGADLTVARLNTSVIHDLAPSIKLPRTGIIDGHITASGTTAQLALDADVRFDDSRAGRSHVTAKGDIGLEHGFRARDLAVRLLPLQVATVGGNTKKIPVGGVLNGRATINGTTSEGWSVQGDIAHDDRGEHSRLIGSGRYAIAGKRITADATLQPLSLVTAGRFAPSAELRGNVTGHLRAEGTTHDLRVSGDVHSASGGSAEGRGTVVLAGVRTRYDISVALDALNANAFTRRAPVTRLYGTVAAHGQGTKLATANATLAADLSHSSYDTFSVERLHARASLASGLLHLDSLSAYDRGIRVDARGTFGLVREQRGTLTFAASADSLQLLRRFVGNDSGLVPVAEARQSTRMAAARADSARRAEAVRIEQLALGIPLGVSLFTDTLMPIRRDSLAGAIAAAGTLTGNVKELGIDGTVRGTGLVVRGYSAGRLSAAVKSANALDRTVALSFNADADSVQARGQAFERVHANGMWQDKRVTADLRIRQDSLVSYAALGSYTNPAKGEHDIHLDSLRAQFDTLVWRLVHPGGVRFSADAISIDSIDLRSSARERLFANGVAPRTGNIALDVAAENVRVSTVLRALQRNQDIEGSVSASAHVTGTRNAPVIFGDGRLREALVKDIRAPDVDAHFNYSSLRLALDANARDSTGRRVLAGTALLPIDLSISGAAKDRLIPGDLVADVALDSLALGTLPIHSTAIEEVRGMIAGEGHMRGSWKTPLYTGRLALRDGGVTLPASTTGMKVDGAVADAHLTGDSLVLDSLVAFAKGPMRAFGSIDLHDRKHPFANFTASGTDLRVFDSPRGLVDADAHVLAVGPLDALRVTGGGEMKGGYLALKQFRKDLLRVKAPGELSFFTVYDTAETSKDSMRAALARTVPRKVAVIADLDLVIDRGNYYRNRPDGNSEFFTGAGEVVHAHLDQRSNDQWAVGFVRIGGGVAFFRTLAFIPSRGALTFTPHTGAAAAVQQVGERIVWEPGRGLFPLQMLTGGTSTGPSVGLEAGSLFPIRGRELNGYLTMGHLTTTLLQQSGSSLSGSEGWSGQLSGETGALAHRQQGATALGVVLHDIGTGATKEYGLDAFSVSPADVPTELVFGKTGGVRGALIEGGRYVTTDLYVAGQLRFTSGIPGLRIERKFGTTYRLDVGLEPRFVFRAPEELGITHPTSRTGAFGAFLTRLWDF